VQASDTDDATALAFSALGVGFMDRDADAARSAIEKALTLNYDSAQAFGLGAAVYSVIGDFDRVVKYAQRSIKLSPFDPFISSPSTLSAALTSLALVTRTRLKRRNVRCKSIRDLRRPTSG
jgi:tetratricopeptide (TPR) repeat protein